LKVQASLTASGKGMSIEGVDKTVSLHGSIQTKDYNSNGNPLHISFDSSFISDETRLENTAKSAKPVLHISSFMLTEWRENEQ
jgi:hypothetical protein